MKLEIKFEVNEKDLTSEQRRKYKEVVVKALEQARLSAFFSHEERSLAKKMLNDVNEPEEEKFASTAPGFVMFD